MGTTRTTRDKSKAAQRADANDAVRKEYRQAGVLDGMVLAWELAKRVREHYETEVERVSKEVSHDASTSLKWARNGARVAELAIARDIRKRFPKSGAAELTARGWVPAGSGDRE